MIWIAVPVVLAAMWWLRDLTELWVALLLGSVIAQLLI